MSEALRTPCSWNFQYFLSEEYGYFPDFIDWIIIISQQLDNFCCKLCSFLNVRGFENTLFLEFPIFLSEEYGYFPDIIDWIVVKSLKTSIANQLKRQSSIETGVGQCINIPFYKWCFLFLGSDSESLLQSWFVYYQGENMLSAWTVHIFFLILWLEVNNILYLSSVSALRHALQ